MPIVRAVGAVLKLRAAQHEQNELLKRRKPKN